MTPQPRKRTIAIPTFLNVSRSKGALKIKFGELIEYKARKVFLEKSNTRCGEEAIPRSFSKNQD